MVRFVHKELCQKKQYRSKNYGSEDRRQILAVFRFVCERKFDKYSLLKKYLNEQFLEEMDRLLSGEINRNCK